RASLVYPDPGEGRLSGRFGEYRAVPAAAKRRRAVSSVAPICPHIGAPCVLARLAFRAPGAALDPPERPLMVEYVGPSSSAARRGVDLSDVGALLRRLDWVMLLAVGGLVAYGLWAIAGVTRFDVPGEPNYYVVRQAI